LEYKIRPALTIIDIQNGFVAGGGSFDRLGYDISQYQKVLPVIEGVYKKAKSLRIPVFFSQALREKSGIDMLDRSHKILPDKRRERIKKLPLCVRGTWDSEFIDSLKPADDDLVVQKRRDSIFQDTEFELWLRSLKIDTIMFAGIDTSICVESSLRDGFNRGWDVILLSDATASLRDDFHNTTIAETKENFGLVITSQELFDNLKQTGDNEFAVQISHA
jgi:ureidoacrylate peracid hydrolase